MAFTRTITVRFDEADARGILFYGRLQELAHRVFEDFVVSELVERWEDWFLNEQFLVPMRHAEADFYRPLKPGCRYEVELVVTKLGESSFEITTRFFDRTHVDRALCAETHVVHVFADAGTMKKMPIPPPIRARLQRHVADVRQA